MAIWKVSKKVSERKKGESKENGIVDTIISARRNYVGFNEK
jgi:hypothetical protein